MPDWGIINKADPSLEYTTQFWSTDKNAVAWEKEASFPGRMLLCAIAYGNYVYGVDGDGYIWRYDPDSQNWSQKSQLPAANSLYIACMSWIIISISVWAMPLLINQLRSYLG